MMVRRREEQAGVLVQAVQNHNPDVIIVDEIGTKAVSVGWLATQAHPLSALLFPCSTIC
jgi:stage III sporulation protein SpoIIIAA